MKYLKRFWNWLLGKTTIDEKIEAKGEIIEPEESSSAKSGNAGVSASSSV